MSDDKTLIDALRQRAIEVGMPGRILLDNARKEIERLHAENERRLSMVRDLGEEIAEKNSRIEELELEVSNRRQAMDQAREALVWTEDGDELPG